MTIFLWVIGVFLVLAVIMFLLSLYVQLTNPDMPQFRVIEITLASGQKRYTVEEWTMFGYEKSSRRRQGFYGMYVDEAVSVEKCRAELYIERIEREQQKEKDNKEVSRRVL